MVDDAVCMLKRLFVISNDGSGRHTWCAMCNLLFAIDDPDIDSIVAIKRKLL